MTYGDTKSRTSDAPVSPSTVPVLMQAIADPNMSTSRIADVVSTDSGLAARVLAVANSAAFGLSRQVTQLDHAVSMVGVNLCQTLAIAGSCSLLDGDHGLPGLREHSLTVACSARLLAPIAGVNRADAFSAGLLHDFGEMLLWEDDPERYADAYGRWSGAAEQLFDERSWYGTDHALVAREQLTEWNFPGVVVDAVGDHHRPDLSHRDLSTVVAAAEQLADPEVEWSDMFAALGLDADGVVAHRADLAEAVEEIRRLLPG